MSSTAANTEYLDTLNMDGNCPGFYLWDVVATDGKTYRMAADHKGGLSIRLFFQSHGKLDVASAERVGDNPDALTWKAARGM